MESLLTMKAIPVTELEMEKNTITGEYSHNFDGKMSIKLGNQIYDTHLSFCTKWIKTSTNEDGTVKPSHIEPAQARITNMHMFDTLTNVGIEIDFSEVLDIYNKSVEKAKIEQKEIEENNLKLLIINRGEAYDKSWIHTYEQDCRNVKKFKTLTHSVEFSKSDKDKYVSVLTEKVTIKYRGKSCIINKETYNKVTHFKFNYITNASTGNTIYDGNKGYSRKSVNHTLLFFKFVEIVDSLIAISDSKKLQLSKEENEREIVKSALEKASGEEVTIVAESKYDSTRWAKPNTYYTLHKFIIKLNDISYSIKKNTPSKYENGVYINVEDETTYSIAGIEKLSGEKFKSIIAILKA